MPTVTQITPQKRRPNRRNVYLDGQFAFGCNVNVVARFRLRPGLSLNEEQIREIQFGEVKQECFDRAMRYIQSRLHSRAELRRKLTRQEFGEPVIDAVLDELMRLGYVNDAQFARQRAQSAAQHKHHGRRRALMELRKSGVETETAERALDEVYDPADSTAVARTLALKQVPRLRKLDPLAARRRLVGMLGRRGFEYESIKPVVDEVLGRLSAPTDSDA